MNFQLRLKLNQNYYTLEILLFIQSIGKAVSGTGLLILIYAVTVLTLP